MKYNRYIKFSFIILFAASSGSIVLPILTGMVYPYAHLPIVSGIIIIIMSSIKCINKKINMLHLIQITILSVLLRIRVFFFTDSLIGLDPHNFSTIIADILSTSSIESINLSFYENAPLFFIETAIAGKVLSYNATAANIITPISVGIIIPLFTAILVNQFRPTSHRTVVFAAGGSSLLPYGVKMSYIPIPQSLGHIFLYIAIVSLITYILRDDQCWLILGLLTMLAGIYTHKITPFLITLSVIGVLTYIVFQASVPTSTRTRDIPIPIKLVAILAVLTMFQLFIINRTGSNFLLFNFVEPISGSSTDLIEYSAATASSSLSGKIFRFTYIVSLAFMSGIIGVYWLYKSISISIPTRDTFYLGVTYSFAGGTIFIYLAGVNLGRILFDTELMLFILIATGGYWHIINSDDIMHSNIGQSATIIMILFVFLSGTTPLVAIDNSDHHRQYLTKEEVDAKKWGYETMPGEVLTDQYYATALPNDYINNASTIKSNYEGFSDGSQIYSDNEFSERKSIKVAHRSCITNYRTPSKKVTLEYDVDNTLSTSYNSIYDSGCVSYFVN